MLKDKVVILDLDQTVISAEADDEYNFDKHKHKAKKFNYKDMDGYYIVFERPGLQKFLDFLFEHFNVSIWTAASKDYALFIIDKIILNGKKNRHVDWIFFSYHCDISKRLKSGTKDLSILWENYKIPGYSKDNTVIIDDYDEVHNTQPDNCIIALPFEFTEEGSEKDDYLKKLQPELLKMKSDKTGKPARAVNEALNPNSNDKSK
jgi:TFIIF-interacting CTD phosphatase-like protein